MRRVGVGVEPDTDARRTALCVPASVPRFVERARKLPVDMVILDLEDSVVPALKNHARSAAATALADDDWQAPLRAVRINAPDSPWVDDDLTGLGPCMSRLTEIVVPKVHTIEQLDRLSSRLACIEEEFGRQGRPVGFHIQVEDAAGLLSVDQTAAHPRVTTLAFGPVDYAASLGLRNRATGHSESQAHSAAYDHGLMRMLVAARAHDKFALDGPCIDIRNTNELARSCEHSAALGLDGKWILHPDQLDATRLAFTPSKSEVAHAKSVMAALHTAEGHTPVAGAAIVDGKMVDEATLRHAQRLLARAGMH